MEHRRPLEERIEVADNPEPRCPCILLLDTSGSMKGAKLAALTSGLHTFRESLAKDAVASRRIELSVVTFNTRVRQVQPFTSPDRFSPPALTASGETHMAAGIERALDLVNERKAFYAREGLAYYRPWIFMITDGKSEGETGAAVAAATARLRSDERAKRVALFAVGVQGADMAALAAIVRRSPLALRGLAFDELFQWLSTSLHSVSRSQPGDVVTLPKMTWLQHVVEFIGTHRNAIENTSVVLRVAAKVATGI